MSGQRVPKRIDEWGATFDLAKDIVVDALNGKTVVENEAAGTIDFDYGAVVVTCAPVLEAEKGRTLARNFNSYGNGAAVFGPKLTNDEVEALKRDFKVTTVARTEGELRTWARNLDKSVAKNLTESIEHANEALKPARSGLELLEFGVKARELFETGLKLEGLREILRSPEGVEAMAAITAIATPVTKTTEVFGPQTTMTVIEILRFLVKNPRQTLGDIRDLFAEDVRRALSGMTDNPDRLPLTQPKHRIPKERTHESPRSPIRIRNH
jgi:hypothetical protein